MKDAAFQSINHQRIDQNVFNLYEKKERKSIDKSVAVVKKSKK